MRTGGRGDLAKEAAVVRKDGDRGSVRDCSVKKGMTEMAGSCGEMERVIGRMRLRDEIDIVATWEKRDGSEQMQDEVFMHQPAKLS